MTEKPMPTIRESQPSDYDEIGRVWMDDWVSVGLKVASEKLLADLRARCAGLSRPRHRQDAAAIRAQAAAGRNLAALCDAE
jgi:hypothetical protein